VKNLLSPSIMILILGAAMQVQGITREDAVNAASAEVTRSYSSASDSTLRWLNVFRPEYTYGSCTYSHSPTWDKSGNGLDPKGSPNPFSWTGAPYCYGNSKMGSSCQAEIDAGKGVGASACHYSSNGNNTSNWATGVDCAEAVGQWLGYQANTQSTYTLETNSDPISWEQLQPGDILLKTSGSRHVMMFESWAPYLQSLNLIEASASAYRVKSISLPQQYLINNQYYPRAPTVFGGDPAACLEYFKPFLEGNRLSLIWETAVERNTWAFRIEQSSHPRGPWKSICDWIRAAGSPRQGARYAVVEDSYPGWVAYYRLIERELSGRTIIMRTICVGARLSNGTKIKAKRW